MNSTVYLTLGVAHPAHLLLPVLRGRLRMTRQKLSFRAPVSAESRAPTALSRVQTEVRQTVPKKPLCLAPQATQQQSLVSTKEKKKDYTL